MKWVYISLCLYLVVGLGVTISEGKQLIIESIGEHYDSKHLLRLKVLLVVKG